MKRVLQEISCEYLTPITLLLISNLVTNFSQTLTVGFLIVALLLHLKQKRE
jgi:hypothetical protein